MVQIWDPFVRLCHWVLVAGFAVAYLTGEDLLNLHAWAGYVIGALVLLSIAWGFIGSKHARFRDFVYHPRTVLAYLRDLPRGRSRRYLGHSPAGGAMVIVLLVCLGATVWSGLVVYAEEEGAGPLAPLYASDVGDPDVDDDDEDEDAKRAGEEGRRRGGGSNMEDIHDFLANLTLALIFLHIAGVVLASFAHRENLAWSMVTGRKRPDDHG
jgi:cytochrome b